MDFLLHFVDFSTNNNNNGAAAPGNAGAANSNPNNVNQSTSATDETSQDANGAANDNDGGDYVDEANSTNDNSDDNAAIDPNNSEDYNDSSDNSNTNPNGNGSNGNNVNFNQVNRNNNEPPAQQAQGQSAFPDYDIDNSQLPPSQFNIPQGGGGAQPLLLDPRNFNGRGINSGGGRGGPAIPPSQLNQPYGLPSEYQNFQYPGFSDYGSQYQQPSSPFGYSAGYY